MWIPVSVLVVLFLYVLPLILSAAAANIDEKKNRKENESFDPDSTFPPSEFL